MNTEERSSNNVLVKLFHNFRARDKRELREYSWRLGTNVLPGLWPVAHEPKASLLFMQHFANAKREPVKGV